MGQLTLGWAPTVKLVERIVDLLDLVGTLPVEEILRLQRDAKIQG
jgi:hypothetical protein